MTPLDGGVPVTIRLPEDRMIADRLRRAARGAWRAARILALLPLYVRRLRRVRPPSAASIRRLLVVRTDRLGDMALSTMALQDLRHHFRKAEITVLAPPSPLALLEAHPAVDRRIELKGSDLPPDLVGRFDLAIDLTPTDALLGPRLLARSRAPLRAGFGGAGREVFLNLSIPRPDRSRHLIDLNRDLLQRLGVPPVALRPALHVTRDEIDAARSRLGALGSAPPRVAIHPGGTYPSQRWSPECFAEVVVRLTGGDGAACIVLAGPGEEEEARRICDATPDALPAGRLSVREMMATLSLCDLFVGNNSGPLHIAGAMGVPTVSVSGPTHPGRFGPRGVADSVVRLDLPCSPCDRGRCWHHTCLRAIEPMEVYRLASESLRAPEAREAAL